MITETEWYHALWAAFQTFIITRLFQEALYLQKKKKKNMTDLSPSYTGQGMREKSSQIQYCGKKDSKYLKSVANISKSLKGYEFNLLLNTGDWSTLHGSEWNDKIILFYVFLSTSKQTDFQNKDQTATHEWSDVHKHGANGACVIYILFI